VRVQASRLMPDQGRFEACLLMANWRDGSRPNPLSLPVRMRSSTRAGPR
jgi:hypothetical protein